MSTTTEDLLREQRRRGVPTTKRTAVDVNQAPLRAWHWINALSITVLAITGWFLANPLPSMPGEASDHFVMGYFRFFHFAAAYVFAVGVLFRIYWAFVGNKYSHQLFTLPFWRARSGTNSGTRCAGTPSWTGSRRNTTAIIRWRICSWS